MADVELTVRTTDGGVLEGAEARAYLARFNAAVGDDGALTVGQKQEPPAGVPTLTLAQMCGTTEEDRAAVEAHVEYVREQEQTHERVMRMRRDGAARRAQLIRVYRATRLASIPRCARPTRTTRHARQRIVRRRAHGTRAGPGRESDPPHVGARRAGRRA